MNEASQILRFFRPGAIPTALLIFAFAWLLSQAVKKFSERLGDRVRERRLVVQQIATLIRFAIYIVAFVVSVPIVFALSNEMLLALGGIIAVAVGFALKDLSSSMIAGITLLVDRPFQVGDRVSYGGYYGEILSIGLRSVRLLTLDESLVTIPNSKFLSDLVSSTNAGALNALVQLDYHIGIDQDLVEAKRIVTEAILSSTYAFLGGRWSVEVAQVIHEQYFALRLRAKVFVMDVRNERALETDVTERVIEAFRAARILPPAILSRILSAEVALGGVTGQGTEPESRSAPRMSGSE